MVEEVRVEARASADQHEANLTHQAHVGGKRDLGRATDVDELALLGFEVAEATVAKYMVKHKPVRRGQTWSTFLNDHMDVTAACDFFVVPTLTFKMLYVFVVLSHDRRRIMHVNGTAHPTAEWTARQLVEAFPFQTPRFPLRDQDGIYKGWEFKRMVEALRLDGLFTTKVHLGRTAT